jgi:hypothetical protein
MSAFQVTPNHIGALVRFYLNETSNSSRGYWQGHVASHTDAEAMFNALQRENDLSVAYRYASHEIEQREALDHISLSTYPKLTPIEAIKACDCLSYQSCEHPEWEASDAYKLLAQIKDAAIYQLPGYSDAPWGIG